MAGILEDWEGSTDDPGCWLGNRVTAVEYKPILFEVPNVLLHPDGAGKTVDH